MRITKTAVIRLATSAIAMVGATACARRTAPVPLPAAQIETCGPVLHDSIGPTPRTPVVDRIAPDSGALVGTAVDAQWGTGMAQVLVRL